MKQVDHNNVHKHRQVAKEVAVSAVKFDGKPHTFNYPSDGIAGSSKRRGVEAKRLGPGILTKGVDLD